MTLGSTTHNPVAASAAATRAARVATLNDALRRTFTGGRVMISAGEWALPEEVRAALLAAVQGFDAFGPDNDPHGEQDFGIVEVGGTRCFWKIDTYDLALSGHSPDPADPADPAVTTRVLTVMLPEEW